MSMVAKTKNVTDMTVGSPLKHLIKFAIPLLIGNLFQQLYNMVDSIVVGRYVGATALGAVGACGSMSFLFFSVCMGLATGVGIIVSQYYGAGEEKKIKETIANSVYVLLSAAVAVWLLAFLFAPALLEFLKTPPEMIEDSIAYMRVSCYGLIAIAVYNGVASILRALGDSKTPLYFLILSSIVNVALDLVFVRNFGMGVTGVALATVIAQYVSAVACLIYAYLKVSYFRMNLKDLLPRKEIIFQSYKLGIPVALQNSMIAVSCMALQGVVNSFGATVVSAYTIIGRIEQLVQQPYGSLGIALTTFTGQNVGAGKLDRVKAGYRKSVLLVLIFSLSLIPIAYIFGEQIIRIFVTEKEVVSLAVKAFRINSLGYFALGMIYVPRAALNGCGDTGFAMINGITEVLCRVGYSQILTRIPFIGAFGVWLTTLATWITTAIVCVYRYRSGKWKDKSVVKHKKNIEIEECEVPSTKLMKCKAL